MKKFILSILFLVVVAGNAWGDCGVDEAYDYDPNRPDDVWSS